MGERGREAKRQWQDIAGRAYGVKVASDWRPDGWLADMDAMTTQQAEEAVTAAREALAALHQVQAVTEAEFTRARRRPRSALPGLQAALQAASGQGPGHTRRLWTGCHWWKQGGARSSDAGAELTHRITWFVPRARTSLPVGCPHCNGKPSVDQ